MINIITNQTDGSTINILEWLNFYGYEYNLLFGDENIDIEFDKINKKTDNIYWTRKLPQDIESAYFLKGLYNVTDEYSFWLNNPKNKFLDKATQLSIAKTCCLSIPKTLISSNKQSIKNFIEKHKTCVIKNYINKVIKKKNSFHNFYTQRILSEEIDSLPENIYIIQQEIKKEYEIRTFYLDSEFYSMAIFSQNDKQTEVDYRRYNNTIPNRTVPYKLPERIEKKLHLFMTKCKLNCGSIDIIKGTDNGYYFLEVNPFGQFGMVSYPCNYHLEKDIALKLIAEYEKRKKK